MAKRHSHTVIVTLHFNKPCHANQAQREARDYIHGTHYTMPDETSGATTMRIGAVRSAPVPARPKADRR